MSAASPQRASARRRPSYKDLSDSELSDIASSSPTKSSPSKNKRKSHLQSPPASASASSTPIANTNSNDTTTTTGTTKKRGRRKSSTTNSKVSTPSKSKPSKRARKEEEEELTTPNSKDKANNKNKFQPNGSLYLDSPTISPRPSSYVPPQENWLDVLSESVAWVLIPVKDTPSIDGFWWPVLVPLDIFERPLPLIPFIDSKKEILPYLDVGSNELAPVISLQEPSPKSLCSFLHSGSNILIARKCPFNNQNYIVHSNIATNQNTEQDDNSVATATITTPTTNSVPSKEAFESALSAASDFKCQEEGDLPDIGTESAWSITRRTEGEKNHEQRQENLTKSLDSENEDESEQEKALESDVSTDNYDPGPDEVDVGDSVLAYWPKYKRRLTQQDSRQQANSVANALQEPWWPAKIVEYIPPPKRRKRKSKLIQGSYRLLSFDGYERIFDSRAFFAAPNDPTFRKCIVGEFAIRRQLSKNQLVEALSNTNSDLGLLIQGKYHHDNCRHESFIGASAVKRRLGILNHDINHSPFSLETVDLIQDWLNNWLKFETNPSRSTGCEEFENLSDIEKSNYASEVLLPIVLELLTIDLQNLEQKVIEEQQVENQEAEAKRKAELLQKEDLERQEMDDALADIISSPKSNSEQEEKNIKEQVKGDQEPETQEEKGKEPEKTNGNPSPQSERVQNGHQNGNDFTNEESNENFKIRSKAHELARIELERPDWVSEIVAQHTLMTKNGKFDETQEEEPSKTFTKISSTRYKLA